jgi:hypothetical protein
MANAQKPGPSGLKHRRTRKGAKPNPRRVAGVLLWAAGIAAGIFGGNYGLLVALTLLVAGFFLFATNPADKR